ncbi:MFS transporter [Amycolatopsis taiwanensis]|uniref:MFS transporter n=1 Tax=Amycolatopsis taiwanensis TaxID=342230 RepID=A0A9W6R576_9PSEU|nr:MFS transporter [Amycolatopsis taiwanensis]GLY67705.1 MFS transporter [Amycolatopsis taiwanensis]
MISRTALYVGGLLGPFGAGVTSAMLPELARTFDVSENTAASSLTAYLLPFALVMVVSGTLGERWGRNRTIRGAYVLYLVAALLSVFAPWFWLFQVGRGFQGVANAFITPLLLTKLADVTPKPRLGRTLGTYGAVQSIGQTSSPLVGGLAAEGVWGLAPGLGLGFAPPGDTASWRWAFIGIAVVACVLASSPLPADGAKAAAPARLRDAWQPTVVWTGAVIFLAWACLAGLPFLVAFRVDDLFALGPGVRGLVLTAFGVAGFLSARPVGAAADRFGPRAAICGGLLLGAIAIGAIGVFASLPVVVAAWALGGVCGQLILVGINASVLAGAENGRSGAISVVTALRFLGMAASPGAFTGLYHREPALGFLVPAGLLALTIPLAALSRARTREVVAPGPCEANR